MIPLPLRSRLVLVSTLAWIGIDWSIAAAQPSDVEALIKKGTELRKRGEDNQALPLFQKAYELAGTPRTAAQLGLVDTQLGYRLEAESHLTEALAARNDFWIGKYRTTLEDVLRRVQASLGNVLVSGTPTGAQVSVNGKPKGTLPLSGPVRVLAGSVRIELHAPGYTDAGASVTVAGGGREQVTLNLTRASVPTTAVSGADHSSGTVPSVMTTSAHGPDETASSWSAGKIAGATLIGTGALAVGGGSVLLLFDKHETCDTGSSSAMCERRTQTRIPGWTFIGAGVVACAVGGVLVYNSPTAQVAVSGSPSSIAVSGRF